MRKDGYYWIKRGNEWIIGYYDGRGYWKIIGMRIVRKHGLGQVLE